MSESVFASVGAAGAGGGDVAIVGTAAGVGAAAGAEVVGVGVGVGFAAGGAGEGVGLVELGRLVHASSSNPLTAGVEGGLGCATGAGVDPALVGRGEVVVRGEAVL